VVLLVARLLARLLRQMADEDAGAGAATVDAIDEQQQLDGDADANADAGEQVAYDDALEDEWVKTVVWDLVLWRHPVLTGLWLVVFFLVSFLMEVSEYSVLTLFSYLVLLQLVATTGAIKSAPALKSVGLLRASFDAKVFAHQRQAFTPDELTKFARGTALIAYGYLTAWNDALVTRDARKVLRTAAAMLGLAALGAVLSVDQALLLLVLATFSLPKIYELEGDRVDEFAAVVHEAVAKRVPLDRAKDAARGFAERLEPVLGSL